MGIHVRTAVLVRAASMLATLSVGFTSAGCSEEGAVGPAEEIQEKNGQPVRVYPVARHAQVENKALDDWKPGSIKGRVLNAVAYARYGVQVLSSDSAAAIPEDPSSIARALGALGAKSGITPARLVQLYAAESTRAEREAYRVHIQKGAHGVDASTPLGRVGERIVDLQKQVNACTASAAGEAQVDAAACCTALATPWFLVDAASKLAKADKLALQQEAGAGTLYTSLPERRIAEAAEGLADAARIQPFEHQNIKAFLSVCSPIVRKSPKTLAELKQRYGDYTKGARWTTELHPISMAKMAARRIYRSLDAKVSIAESIGETCEVRETEVVFERANGVMDFWSYGAEGAQEMHGFFPAKLRVDAIKHTPDSCMGCHYKLDSRAFTVRAPSYHALGLTLRSSQGTPQWVDGSACARKGDAIIWHEK
jgi:hypothetical protein